MLKEEGTRKRIIQESSGKNSHPKIQQESSRDYELRRYRNRGEIG
jgi:hypothetical protein